MIFDIMNYLPVTLGWTWFVIDWAEHRWTYHKMKCMLRKSLLEPYVEES